MSVEEHVQARYTEGAKERQQDLCCPVSYQTELLALLPQEIVEKDYGCGDPSRYVKEGDVVLDLGSGGGKICYMAAQLVGESGHVHGVDMTDDMLALARKYQPHMADKLGQDRVTFHKGYIQNLAFDLENACDYVESQTILTPHQMAEYEAWKQRSMRESPMIADDSISLVISNCVLNLVDRRDRNNMIDEVFRVLKPGGRVAISDIISDRYVPESLQQNPKLWSGCISGAFHESEFIEAFTKAGFVHVAYDQWDQKPWRVVEGIEFRSVTLVAQKPPAAERLDTAEHVKNRALMYIGPHRSITDDFGNVLNRGERTPVTQVAFDTILDSPYASHFVGFEIDPQGSTNTAKFSMRAVKTHQTSSNARNNNQQHGCC